MSPRKHTLGRQILQFLGPILIFCTSLYETMQIFKRRRCRSRVERTETHCLTLFMQTPKQRDHHAEATAGVFTVAPRRLLFIHVFIYLILNEERLAWTPLRSGQQWTQWWAKVLTSGPQWVLKFDRVGRSDSRWKDCFDNPPHRSGKYYMGYAENMYFDAY